MLRMFSLFVGMTVLLAAGCTQETEKAKEPGADAPPGDEQTFRLELPTGATNVSKGGTEQVSIGVDRGDEMQGDVTLTFTPPEGITIEPQSPVIRSGEDEVEITVQADAEAAEGEKSIPVTGEAEGKQAEGTFKVEVTE